MVDFCDNCGALIMGKKGEEVNCPSCGKVKKAKSVLTISKKVERKEELEIVDTSNDGSEINPLTDVECPECGHKKAFYWTRQTRAGDEPETQFYKCEKCKHQWRKYN